MTKALARFSVLDSRRLIAFLLDVLPRLDDVDFASLSDLEKRMLQMFYVTVWGKTAEDWNADEVLDKLYGLADSPVMMAELLELLRCQYNRIDFIDEPVDLGFDCPLDGHSVAPACCCLCGSSRLTASRAVPELIPISARQAM